MGMLLEHTKLCIDHTITFLTSFIKMSNFLVFRHTKNRDLSYKKGYFTQKLD